MSETTVETTQLPESKLTRDQKKEYRKDIFVDGRPVVIVAHVRHDDDCGNGHNSFSVTADIYEQDRHPGELKVRHETGPTLWLSACGCQHDDVARHFPELAHLIKWHLMSTDAPMHYVANACYWAGKDTRWCDGKPTSPPNEAHFKSTIVFGASPGDDGCEVSDLMAKSREDLTEWLNARLLALLEAFKRDVEAVGFVY